jgi:hypothetical protein
MLRLEEAQTIHWGAVNADGELTRYSGPANARNLRVVREGIGRYRIYFSPPAHDAVVVATPVISRTAVILNAGSDPAAPDQVVVSTFSVEGRSSDTPVETHPVLGSSLPGGTPVPFLEYRATGVEVKGADAAFKFIIITATNAAPV